VFLEKEGMLPYIATAITENDSLASILSEKASTTRGSARPSAKSITQPQPKLRQRNLSNPSGSGGTNVSVIDLTEPEEEHSVNSHHSVGPHGSLSTPGYQRQGQIDETGLRRCRIAEIIN
jgi:hypothetical protein